METKKKNALYIAVVVILSALILVSVIMISVNAFGGPQKQIEKKWNIKLPSGMSVLYQKNNLSELGKGDRYTVFELKKEPPQSFLSSLQEDGSFEALIKNALSGLSLPTEHLPKWEESYCIKIAGVISSTRICMLYFPDTLLLIIHEKIV